MAASIVLAACENNPPAGDPNNPTVVAAPAVPPIIATATFADGMTASAIIPSATGTPTAVLVVPCPTPTATSSKGVRDQLNESLLDRQPRTQRQTSKSGLQYYEWYQKLWDNDGFWWWDNHETFTVWDFLTLVLYLELDKVGNPASAMHAGFPAYKEAIVRVIYQDCKEKGCIASSPEAIMNWLAGYSESGSRLCCAATGVPLLKDNPYASAKELMDAIRDPA